MAILSPKPVLPGKEDNRQKREASLAKARDEYQYSYEYPKDVAMVSKVPLHETFSPLYLAKVGELDLKILANHAKSRAGALLGSDSDHQSLYETTVDKLHELEPGDLKNHLTTVSHDMARRIGKELAVELDSYGDFFGTIEAPPIVARFLDQRGCDRSFAWQRLAGPNPMSLHSVTSMPDRFPVSEEHFSRAGIAGDTLAAAMAEGRAFLVDYHLLDGAPMGSTGGYAKHMWAPLALFVATRGPDSELMPVAIQCQQKPGADNPIVTPDQGVLWRIAKLAVQIADGNLHQGIVHLAHTHLVTEAVILACKRNLAPCHPLSILLAPHFQFTLALNEIAQTNLIAPDGQVDYVLGATLEGTLSVVSAGMKSFRMTDQYPDAELNARGVGDSDRLADYPYRDDALLVWRAIGDWVRSYLELYYESDAAVLEDGELASVLRELADAGRIGGLPTVDSTSALADFVTYIIFNASAQHAAVNFPQFSYMGFLPNMPGAAYAPMPTPGEATEQHYLSMLPPMDQSLRQFNIAYQLSNLRDNFLGHYPMLHFRDHRVHKPRVEFEKALEAIERRIVERNQSRLFPYPFLLPSMIPASIHI